MFASKAPLLEHLQHGCTAASILKPVGRAGSEGVLQLEPGSSLNSLSPHIREDYFPYLLETFVEGEEYSIEALVCGGECQVLGLTQKFLFEGTFFEQGHAMPADEQFGQETLQTLNQQLAQICRLTGISHGMVHAEFWLNDAQQITWGEIHNRPGGDFISHMIGQVSGIQIYASQFADRIVSGGTPAQPYMAVWSQALTDQKLSIPETDAYRHAFLARRNMFCTSGNTLTQALDNAKQLASAPSV